METGGEPLLWTTLAVAFVHTILGVDHYLPFIVLGRAQGWSWRRLAWTVTLCGFGHVLSSVLIGIAGIGLGLTLEQLEAFEGVRGSLAAWLLIGFGLAYAAWGFTRALRRRRHQHPHVHADGTLHSHEHEHEGEHAHPHTTGRRAVTGWVLFLIFVFGPCEPFIPLLMAAAVARPWVEVVLLTGVFIGVTLLTMLAAVGLGLLGLRLPWTPRMGDHAHTLSGLLIAVSGILIQTLGI